IATFGEEPFRVMQSLFATRRVKKTYIADLEGDYTAEDIPAKGRIALPLSADWLDRPRQRVDFEEGKEAVTDYEFIEASGGYSRVILHPLTGRTHQLRVHAASVEGLGLPIAGDRLYGNQRVKETKRLCLHAHKIEFTFPIDGCHYCFESPIPF
ncbi:MAG: RNA pseudouridine synthase, partial [Muribaculaceae bacterium]|nr:RNA pseudouridine synthase [Muribaculaceae bacterium]